MLLQQPGACQPCSVCMRSANSCSALNTPLALQVARGQALRRTPAAFTARNTRQVGAACCACLRLLGSYPSSAISEQSAAQVTSAIATGPKPPLTFSNSNDEGSPVKVSIGDGMGKQLGLARLPRCGSCCSAKDVG